MKIFFRILGGLLLGAGGLWTLSTIVSFPGIILEMKAAGFAGWLFWMLVGAGAFCLGLWLFRKPGKKLPCKGRKPSPPKKTARQAPWKTKDPSLWKQRTKEGDGQPAPPPKPAREDPWEARILEWEKELAGTVSHSFMWKGRGAEKLDVTRDDTRVDWFSIGRGGDLLKIVEIYAQFDSYFQSCRASGVQPAFPKNHPHPILPLLLHKERFFILAAGEQFEAMGEDALRCLALCREHHFHLVRDNLDHTYYDYVSGNTYEAYLHHIYSKVHNDEDDPEYGTITDMGVISLRVVKGEAE